MRIYPVGKATRNMTKATKPIAATADRKTPATIASEGGFRAIACHRLTFSRLDEPRFATNAAATARPRLKTRNALLSDTGKMASPPQRDLGRRQAGTWVAGLRPFLRYGGLSIFATVLALGTPGAALAADPQPDYGAIGALLLAFFGLVVLFESGFGLLFQWRLFREFFPVAGWRAPIMFVVSAVLTYNFRELDVFGRSVAAFAGQTTAPQTGASNATWLISAAILAGGSAGMMRIFEQLGIRSAPTEPAPPAIDRTMAWLSLRVVGSTKALKTVVVKIEQVPEGVATHAGIAGTLRNEGFKTRFLRVMGRDLRRFPPSGGYLVEANKPYKITLAYPEQAAIGGKTEIRVFDVFSKEVEKAKDPETVSFASRAVVDLTIDLPA